MIPGSKNMPSRHVPLDIIEKILLKLPGKSVIRLGSVCKTWFDVTKSYRFALLHHAKTDDQCVVQFLTVTNNHEEPTSELVVNLHSDPMRLSEYSPVLYTNDTLSPQLSAIYFKLRGDCNGIVCVSNHAEIFLVNPFLQEMKRIPAQPVQIWPEYCHSMGLGFDHLTNSFKVVTILKYFPKVNAPKYRGQVYNLSTNSWSEVGEILVKMYVTDFSSTFFNGVVHWCGRNTIDDSFQILTFDTTTESFQGMKLPQSDRNSGEPSLLVLKKKYLAFGSKTPSWSSNNPYADIWVMKEYGVEESWIKLHSIGQMPYITQPVYFWEKDKLLLRCHNTIILYDLLEDRALDSIDLSDYVRCRYASLGFRVCTQSLISFSSI